MDRHFPKRKLELEVANRISGAVSASNSKLFRFPSPICIHLRVRDSLLFPSTFLETVLCGARGRAFSVAGFPVRDKRRWYGDESKRDIGSCDSRKPLAVGAPGSFTERLRTESARVPHPLPAGGLGLRSAAHPHCWRRGCVSGSPAGAAPYRAGSCSGSPSHLGSPHFFSVFLFCRNERTAGAPTAALHRKPAADSLLGGSPPQRAFPGRARSGRARFPLPSAPVRREVRRAAEPPREPRWGPGRAAPGLGGVRAAVAAAING